MTRGRDAGRLDSLDSPPPVPLLTFIISQPFLLSVQSHQIKPIIMNQRPIAIVLGSLIAGAILVGVVKAVQVRRGQGPWPECVGIPAEDCQTLILSEAPSLNTFIIPEGSPVTMDYRLDRVRIFVDDNNVVVSAPSRG